MSFNFVAYRDWCVSNKGITPRVAKDYASRLKRITKIMNIRVERVSLETLLKLDDSPSFIKLSPHVKYQLRHSIRVYLEFCKSC